MIKKKNAGSGIADVDKKRSVIVGYASRFGNVDSHGDIIVKGAYSRTIKHNASRIKSLMHHDPVMIVGKPEVLKEDEYGLLTETRVSDTALGRDLLTLVEDGVIDEMSVGFIPIKEEFNKSDGVNYIKEIRLVEYSFVSLASNPEARIQGLKGVAAVNDVVNSMRRAEKALRDGTFMTDDVPEALEFMVKYWRSIIESAEVADSDDVVSSVEHLDDSALATHPVVTPDPAPATQGDVLGLLKSWQEEQEVIEIIGKLGKILEVK